MKKIFAIIVATTLLGACSGGGKYPLDTVPQKPDTGSTTEPDKPEPGPDKPGPGTDPTGDETPISKAFKEDFTERTPASNVVLSQRLTDFRYFSGFPSLSEKNTRILLLRLDPTDAAGPDNGPKLTAAERCFYGSYSARVRLPNTLAVQKNLDASASLGIYDKDESNAAQEISASIKLSDPSTLLCRSQGVEHIAKPSSSSWSASSAFRVIGFDWHKDKVVWWVMEADSKTTIYETSTSGEIPAKPAWLRFTFCHNSSAGAPLYPYELELDWISFEPSDN